MYHLDHVLYLLVDAIEVIIENSFLGIRGLEVVIYRKRVVLIILFFCLDFVHVEVRFAEELGGFELLGLLDIHRAVLAGLGYGEISGSLSADPTGCHIADFRGRYQTVHVLIEIDGSTVSINRNTFLELDNLSENVSR